MTAPFDNLSQAEAWVFDLQKYGIKFGLSSTQAYLNDWFLVPLFALGWLPIIYYSRVTSIPDARTA